LPERRRAEGRRGERAAESLDEVDEMDHGGFELSARQTSRVALECGRVTGARTRCDGRERGEGDQQRGLNRSARRDDGAVTMQAEQIEEATADPAHPELNRERADAEQWGDVFDVIAPEDEVDGTEDDLDAVHFSGERVTRQHALAVPAVDAARQGDPEVQEARSRVVLPAHSSAREPDPGAAAAGAAHAGEQSRSRTGDGRLVSCRVHREYVNHVLESRFDGSGVLEDKAGAVLLATGGDASTRKRRRPQRSLHCALLRYGRGLFTSRGERVGRDSHGAIATTRPHAPYLARGGLRQCAV